MVKILKLSNGEEIVGELVSCKGNEVSLKNPMTIVYKYHPFSSFPYVKLVKYMIFSKDEIYTFDNWYIKHITDARESFSQYYNHVIQMNSDAPQSIDEELKNAVQSSKSDKDELYSSLLEKFQKPDTMN